MVGFDGGGETDRSLDDAPTGFINADLTSQADLTSAMVLRENAGLSFIGTQKTGPFDLTPQQAEAMLAAPPNPNGRGNGCLL
jgi:hypothetical protein